LTRIERSISPIRDLSELDFEQSERNRVGFPIPNCQLCHQIILPTEDYHYFNCARYVIYPTARHGSTWDHATHSSCFVKYMDEHNHIHPLPCPCVPYRSNFGSYFELGNHPVMLTNMDLLYYAYFKLTTNIKAKAWIRHMAYRYSKFFLLPMIANHATIHRRNLIQLHRGEVKPRSLPPRAPYLIQYTLHSNLGVSRDCKICEKTRPEWWGNDCLLCSTTLTEQPDLILRNGKTVLKTFST
jgi:hypothetical protein